MTFCVQCMLEAFVSSDGADLKGGIFEEEPMAHYQRLHADLAATTARRAFLDRESARIGQRLQAEGRMNREERGPLPPSKND